MKEDGNLVRRRLADFGQSKEQSQVSLDQG